MSVQLSAALVQKLNLELDVPFLDEVQEAAAIQWVVQNMAGLLPESLLNFILDASDGLDEVELNRHLDVFVGFLNSKVDIPWMSEGMEAQLLRPVVRAILDMAKVGDSVHVPPRPRKI